MRLKHIPAELLTLLSAGRKFRPAAGYRGDTDQILVINRIPSSTADIYLCPRLKNARLPVTFINLRKHLPDSNYFTGKTFVIISRYINKPWCEALNAYRDSLSGIAYLMDDDIPEAGYDLTLPPGYAIGLAWFFFKYHNRLQELSSELWVSSPYLFEKYKSEVTHLIEPIFIAKERSSAAKQNEGEHRPVTIFYHAQRPHYRDNLWLKDIIVEIQKRYDHTVFETFGGEKVRDAYKTIPRTHVLKRFNWQEYLDFCAQQDHDIGLAPLTNGAFNRARSINKLFDISRCGGAGIYSNSEPYSNVIDNGKTGVLCDQKAEDWINAISSLVEDEQLRKNIYNNCFRYCHDHNLRASTPESLKSLMK